MLCHSPLSTRGLCGLDPYLTAAGAALRVCATWRPPAREIVARPEPRVLVLHPPGRGLVVAAEAREILMRAMAREIVRRPPDVPDR